MKRFGFRYLSVALALCVLVAGAAMVAASSSGDADADAQAKKGGGVESQGRAPDHANNKKLSVRASMPGNGPSVVVEQTPAIERAAPHSAVRVRLGDRTVSVERHGEGVGDHDRRYQWTGEIRPANGGFVLYRGCDRWLLDPQSREAGEALKAYAESGRVDVWGHLSRSERQIIAVDAVYGPGDPRPRILVPDYPCPEDRDPAPKADWVGGWIGEVDTDRRIIVLRLSENGPMRFRVTDDTAIVLDGERARLGSLESGMPARVAFEPRTQNALRIMAASERPTPRPEVETVGGRINVVNESGLSLHLRDGSDVRFFFTDDTHIVLDGERVRPSALEAGMTARVTYDVETREALRVQAASQQPQREPAPTVEWAGGWIEAVDVDGRIIVLRIEDGHMRFKVTDRTGIAIDMQRATLEDLESGMAARIAYDADTGNALRVMAVSNSSQ